MQSRTLTLHPIISESKITYLTFGKNSVDIPSSSLESSTILNSSTVISHKRVSLNVSMPDNMSMILNQISFQSHLYSELSEHAVLSLRIIKMFQQFVNLFLHKLSDAHVISVAKLERKLKNSPIITLMQFQKKEIFGLLRTIQYKINKNTLKF